MEQTFESVNKHVEKNFSKLPKAAAPGARGAAAPQSAKVSSQQLKTIYATVKPILQLVAMLPIIPVKWRQGIQALIAALDVVTTSPTA